MRTRLLGVVLAAATLTGSHVAARPPHPSPGGQHPAPAATGATAPARVKTAGLVEASGPVAAPPAPAAALTPSQQAKVASEAAWIRSAQLPDGAIAVWPDRPVLRQIWPYLGNYAAMGLSQAATVTGDVSDARAAWRYLAWYASEENASGYVSDFTVVNGVTPVPTGSMDSTDAYAATFLAAAWDTEVADPDPAALHALQPGIAKAVQAILSTRRPDGTIGAKPSWPVAYLMDDAEDYGGLLAAAQLAQRLHDPALAAQASDAATTLRAAWQHRWNPAAGAFGWAEHPDGAVQATNWAAFYPDGMEQAWAVAYGLADPAQTAAIAAHLETADRSWADPTATVTMRVNAQLVTKTAGYWPMAGLALRDAGFPAAAAAGDASISASAAASAEAWPYTVATAGQTILLDSGAGIVAGTRP